jgi:flagellar hook-associated protein 2
MASGTVASATAALNKTGSVLINGKTITLKAADSLTTLKDAINSAGAGVSASILSVSATDNRLVLTATSPGLANAVVATDANNSGILQSLGLLNGTTTVKTAITNGAAGDYLASETTAVGATLGLTGAPSGTVSIDGHDIAINLADDSLNAIRQRINDAGIGVTATITADSSSGIAKYRLELTGTAGTPAFTDNNHVLETLGVVKQGVADERVAAKDAHIKVDNYDVYRSSNDISDAISDVTLHLIDADPGSAKQVTVSADDDSTVSSVSSFVSSFNQVMDAINTGESYDTTTSTGGAFFGDAKITLVQERLRDAAMNPITTADGKVKLMSQIGITTDAKDHLVLDEAKLRAALASDADGVKALFATKAQATSAEVTYISSSDQTAASGASGYAVNVSRPASQAAATSAHLSGGITQDETLTINGNCIVTLSAGMTLTQARDAINLILVGNNQSVTASVDGDQLKLAHKLYGSAQTFSVKSSLATGAGGVDLGGASAGQSQIYRGEDIAGTINGETCDGFGQYLTGQSTAAHVAGLRLLIASATSGDKGLVYVTKGGGTRVEDFATASTDTNGLMTSAANGLQASIDAISEEIAKQTDDVQTYIDSMRSKFSAMEAVLAKQKSLADYLTGQFDSMNNSNNK